MKTIFILIGSLTAGGAERVSVSLAEHLASLGHNVTLVTMHGRERDFYQLSDAVPREALDLGTPHWGLGKVLANVRRINAFRRLVRRHRPDVVIGMMTSSAVMSILACWGTPAKTIVSERNFPGAKSINVFWSLLRRVSYRFADLHVVQTQGIAEWLKITSPKEVAIIPNAVSWPVPAFLPCVRPSNYVAPSLRLILAVGTKVHQKGFDMLLRAFELCAAEHNDWHLAILGIDGGALDGMLHAEIADRVHVPGRVGNVGEWYARADIFVLSSRYEGFPNVLLEAMASACASVAFDCPTGPGDLIVNGVNGLLVEAENEQALADAMQRTMTDAGLRQRMGAEATSVRSTYSESRIYGQWAQLIGEL